jgi:hypothetical protein
LRECPVELGVRFTPVTSQLGASDEPMFGGFLSFDIRLSSPPAEVLAPRSATAMAGGEQKSSVVAKAE